MKIIIILLIINSSMSFAQNKEDDKKTSLAMASLNDLDLISLPCTLVDEVFDENEKRVHYRVEAFRKLIVRDINKGTLRKVANNLDCDNDCQKNYEILRSKMNFKNLDQYFYQDIYDSIEMNKVVGQLISTCPLTVKYSNNFYTNENWKEDYKTIEDSQVFNYSGVYNRNEFAMWVYQLKKFIYLRESTLFYGHSEEQRIRSSIIPARSICSIMGLSQT